MFIVQGVYFGSLPAARVNQLGHDPSTHSRVNESTLVVELYSNDDSETNMNERFLAIDVR